MPALRVQIIIIITDPPGLVVLDQAASFIGYVSAAARGLSVLRMLPHLHLNAGDSSAGTRGATARGAQLGGLLGAEGAS